MPLGHSLVKLGPLPGFEETVTLAVTDQVIEYRITKGSPLPALGTGTRLHDVIEFGAVVPLLDRVIALGLDRNVRQGLKTIDARA